MIILLSVIAIISFIIGIIQKIRLLSNDKKKPLIIITILTVLLSLLFSPYIILILAFSYKPEHTVTLDDKKDFKKLDVKDIAKGTPREESLFDYAGVPDKYRTIRKPLYEEDYYDDYDYIYEDEKDKDDDMGMSL